MAHKVKVCVIGAGVSGLKAAHTLVSSRNTPFSAEDVLILEAQDRIGGRIKTDKTLSKCNASYDLGASWFHDVLTNSVLRDSIAMGLFDPSRDGYFDDKPTAYHALEKLGKLETYDLKLKQVMDDIESFIELYYARLDAVDMSLKSIVEVYMRTQDKLLTCEQKDYCGRMMRYMELWYGIDYEKISGKYAVMRHQGRNLFNKKGYSYLIDHLARPLHSRIMKSKPVKCIRRKSGKHDSFHTVITTDETRIEADYLVVTVPHSILVLEESHEYSLVWQPPLPKHMTDSFQSIHFGALGKVIIEFDQVWWDMNEERFTVLAHDRSGGFNNYHIDGLKPQPFEYPIYVVNHAKIHPGSNSLIVLTQSPVTEFLEQNPHEAWNYLQPLLQTIHIDSRPTQDGMAVFLIEHNIEPLNVIVTDWTQNPYIRGSYCALHVDDDPIDELIQLSGEHDVCGLGAGSTIRFAGEHTAADGAGCVHGAYDSGTRAANWILQHETSTATDVNSSHVPGTGPIENTTSGSGNMGDLLKSAFY